VTRRRRIAIGLAVTLVVLAALTGVYAALLEDQPPGQSLDPHHAGVAVAGGFAVLFCSVALWRLREVARARAGWLDAGFWLAVAALSLLAVVTVGILSRLGG